MEVQGEETPGPPHRASDGAHPLHLCWKVGTNPECSFPRSRLSAPVGLSRLTLRSPHMRTYTPPRICIKLLKNTGRRQRDGTEAHLTVCGTCHWPEALDAPPQEGKENS